VPSAAPPARLTWRKAVERILIPQSDLTRRVRELASQIQSDYADRELVLLPILSGTVLFIADLVRHLDLPLRLDFLGISSYGNATRPGRIEITLRNRLALRNRHVLVVDDILDTGRTLRRAVRLIRQQHPRSLRTCVLLEKDLPQRGRLRPDYVGFRIPNVFVVGYGLDHAERFRNLPFVGVLRRPLKQPA
jgi:hypoxanthine phosphoribosyltransferase